ncbi:MAG: 1,4-dihydroxy-2-naphthoate polyprenyltransferase [Symbiobacteriia bacterium]
MNAARGQDIKASLNERSGIHAWWRLLRPHTLTAAFVPVFIGTMLAATRGRLNLLLFSAMLLASLLIQAATNMFNEYYDYVRGLDNESSVGIGGAIVRDGIAPKTVLSLALGFFGTAILLGLYISASSSWWVVVIGLVSMLIGYLYTGGPYPIAYTPFGELVAGFFMGTVIVATSYYIQALALTGDVLWVSVPAAILVGAILLANNIRDLDGDRKSGRRTVAILLGRTGAIRLLAAAFAVAYGMTAVLIGLGLLPLWSVVAFLSMKRAWDAVRGFIGKIMPIEMFPAMKATAETNTLYGFLLGLSLLLQAYAKG